VVGFPGQELTPSTNVAHCTEQPAAQHHRAYLEVTLEGHGCDEQWFSDVPADIAAKYPSAGCARTARTARPTRHWTARGRRRHTFPHIYTGGIVPTLWRPIPAIHTFSLYAERWT